MSISFPQADFAPQLVGYTGQGNFRFWCQKVLPIVYDDSLSYYELLNKVVIYLNNCIKDVANVEDNVASLYAAYKLLEDFVNNYVSEVNPVLIEEILAKHPEWTTTVQDGSITIQKLNDAIKPFVVNDYITPEMYGCVGDGVADDTSNLQLSIDAAISQNKPFLATKKYLTSETVRISGYRNPDTHILETGRHLIFEMSNSVIDYRGDEYALQMTGLEECEFKFGTIIAENGGCVNIPAKSSWSAIAYCRFIGGEMRASTENDCITVSVTGTGWANQCQIMYTHFASGLYAVHMISESSNKINEWSIDWVGLEGKNLLNGHYLESKSSDTVSHYIRDIRFMYNRAIEHIDSQGKKFLKTWGKVINCRIDSGYGRFDRESAYDFQYDDSGTTSYQHIAHNIEINTPWRKIVVFNGKFVVTPLLMASDCNVDHITDLEDADNSIYKNWYGSFGEFSGILSIPSTGEIPTARNCNLNNKWLAGAVTDVQANKRILQELTLETGEQYVRNRNGANSGDWFIRPLAKSERKVLHQSTFKFSSGKFGLLTVSTLGNYVAIYWVRWAVTTQLVKIFDNWPNEWTITTTGSSKELYFENPEHTGEYVVTAINFM